MNYVGIDISKNTFDVAFEKNGSYFHYQFSNDASGFSAFFEHLELEQDWCVMEATGPYYLKLAFFLDEKGVNLSVVNPLVIRRFCQMKLMKAKTDKKDAAMIALYGKTEQPKAWEAEEGYVLELRQMYAYLEQLEKSRTAFLQQLHAFEQNPVINKRTIKNLMRMLKATDKQIADQEQGMEELISQHHNQMFEQLKSIPGIGKKTAMLLLVITGGFTKFENPKQLSSYVGLSPRIFESGSSVKARVRICKMGTSRMRALLYVCSWSAIKHNEGCKKMYERLVARQKPKMVALIAVVNKLLKQAFAIATKGTFYDKNYSLKTCF